MKLNETWKEKSTFCEHIENASSNISVRDLSMAGDIITNVNDAKTISQGYKQAISLWKRLYEKKRFEAKKTRMNQV